MTVGKQWWRAVAMGTPIVLGVMVMVGCETSAAGGEPQEPLALTEAARGSSVELAVDQILEISLPGNPTTGYSWTAEATGAPRLTVEEPTYAADSTDSTLVGGGGTYTFTFTARQPGTTRVELTYRRSWETDAEPLETFAIDVTVR